jgi:hypothetical protein
VSLLDCIRCRAENFFLAQDRHATPDEIGNLFDTTLAGQAGTAYFGLTLGEYHEG